MQNSHAISATQHVTKCDQLTLVNRYGIKQEQTTFTGIKTVFLYTALLTQMAVFLRLQYIGSLANKKPVRGISLNIPVGGLQLPMPLASNANHKLQEGFMPRTNIQPSITLTPEYLKAEINFKNETLWGACRLVEHISALEKLEAHIREIREKAAQLADHYLELGQTNSWVEGE